MSRSSSGNINRIKSVNQEKKIINGNKKQSIFIIF